MSAAQPANPTISVFYRLRTVRNHGRHTSIKALTTPFDTMNVAVPGEETQVVETRDATFRTDAFRLGHPVVVAPRVPLTLKAALAAVTGIDMPVRLIGNPREVQIQKTAAHKTDDLYAQVAAAQAGKYHTTP